MHLRQSPRFPGTPTTVFVSVPVSVSYEKIPGGKSLQRNTETTPPHNLTWKRRIKGAGGHGT